MTKIRTRFVAKSHACWFSKKEEYQRLSVGKVFEIDPDYILWCKENLIHLRFANGIKSKINKYKREKIKE